MVNAAVVNAAVVNAAVVNAALVSALLVGWWDSLGQRACVGVEIYF